MKLLLPLALVVLSETVVHAHTRFTNLELDFVQPAVIGIGASVTISFDYFTDEPTGFTVVAHPYFGGEVASDTVAILPSFATGSGSGSFTFQATAAMDVDEILIYAIANDRSEVLERFFMPVEFKVRENAAWISSFSVDQPAALPHSQVVTATVEYSYNGTGDGRVWVIPHQGTPTVPNYVYSGSGPVSGAGSFTRDFRVSSGVNVPVDNVRVLMQDEGDNTLVDYRIPVRYWWSTSGVQVVSVVKDDLLGRLDIEVAYQSTEPNGLRISTSPILDVGSFSSFGTSATTPVFGTGSRSLFIDNVVPATSQTRGFMVRAFTDAGSGDIVEFEYPLELPWMRQRSVDVSNLRIWPGTVGRTSTWQLVYVSFDYEAAVVGSRRFFVRPDGPFLGGNPSPAYDSPAGSAFGWIGFDQPGDLATININVNKDGPVEEVIPLPVDLSFYEPSAAVVESLGITESGDFEVLWKATPPENYRILSGDSLPLTTEVWSGSALPTVEEILYSEPATDSHGFFQIERVLDLDRP